MIRRPLASIAAVVTGRAILQVVHVRVQLHQIMAFSAVAGRPTSSRVIALTIIIASVRAQSIVGFIEFVFPIDTIFRNTLTTNQLFVFRAGSAIVASSSIAFETGLVTFNRRLNAFTL